MMGYSGISTIIMASAAFYGAAAIAAPFFLGGVAILKDKGQFDREKAK